MSEVVDCDGDASGSTEGPHVFGFFAETENRVRKVSGMLKRCVCGTSIFVVSVSSRSHVYLTVELDLFSVERLHVTKLTIS